jgi:hypothetical protein
MMTTWYGGLMMTTYDTVDWWWQHMIRRIECIYIHTQRGWQHMIRRIECIYSVTFWQTYNRRQGTKKTLKITRVIRNCKSTKDREYNDHKKKDKRTIDNLQNITQKTKHWAQRTPQQTNKQIIYGLLL